MKNLVNDFPSHVREAISIARNATLSIPNDRIDNVVISGLGGSGIGGTIVSQLLASQLRVPVIVNKDYSIPAFVGSNTLFIASSYSGNTEETLEALGHAERAEAKIAAVTSGGRLAEICSDKGYNCVNIPGGFPPRAAFGYSSIQLFYILDQYGLVNGEFKVQLDQVPELLMTHSESIQEEAKALAKSLHQRVPVIYSDASLEGVGVRFRQQINENSKMLCWHHVLPEMNHNELVGWAEKHPEVTVVLFRTDTDYYRTQERMKYSKELIEQRNANLIEVQAKGEGLIQKAFYLIHLGDYASVFLADLKGIDAVEVDVITGLKNMLAEI